MQGVRGHSLGLPTTACGAGVLRKTGASRGNISVFLVGLAVKTIILAGSTIISKFLFPDHNISRPFFQSQLVTSPLTIR